MPSSCNQGHCHATLDSAVDCNSKYRPLIDAIAASYTDQEEQAIETNHYSDLMVVHDQIGHPLQVGNIVSDSNNTGWLISEIQIRDRSEDPCGYVVGDHNDLTDIFPIRYTDGGAMCFGVRFVRERL